MPVLWCWKQNGSELAWNQHWICVGGKGVSVIFYVFFHSVYIVYIKAHHDRSLWHDGPVERLHINQDHLLCVRSHMSPHQGPELHTNRPCPLTVSLSLSPPSTAMSLHDWSPNEPAWHGLPLCLCWAWPGQAMHEPPACLLFAWLCIDPSLRITSDCCSMSTNNPLQGHTHCNLQGRPEGRMWSKNSNLSSSCSLWNVFSIPPALHPSRFLLFIASIPLFSPLSSLLLPGPHSSCTSACASQHGVCYSSVFVTER